MPLGAATTEHPSYESFGAKMPDDLPGLLIHITKGWHEKVEYAVSVQLHTPYCNDSMLDMSMTELRHYECECPSFKEYRAEQRFQAPLLTQLIEAGYTVPQNGEKSGGGGSVNKPQSKVPGNLVRPDEILHDMLEVAFIHLSNWFQGGMHFTGRRNQRLEQCLTLIREHAEYRTDEELETLEHDLQRLVKRARILLGYDSDTQTFADTVCGSCGGKLIVARELPVEVKCGTCGHSYPWQSWLRMFESGDGRALVDTEVACFHAGVPRGTLYRWASEGRITRYGSRGKGKALWNLMEIDPRTKS